MAARRAGVPPHRPSRPCGGARSAKVLDLDSLCIEEGRSAWAVCADVVCVSYDGNVTDTALLALVAALRDVRVPKPVAADDGAITIDPRARGLPARGARGERTPHPPLTPSPPLHRGVHPPQRAAGLCRPHLLRGGGHAGGGPHRVRGGGCGVHSHRRAGGGQAGALPPPCGTHFCTSLPALIRARGCTGLLCPAQTCGVRKYGGTPLAFDVLHRVSDTCDAVLEKQLRRLGELCGTE